MRKSLFITLVLSLCSTILFAQNADSLKIADYSSPKEYIVDTIMVSGVQFLDKNVLANMSGIMAGDKITLPSDDVTKLIKKYWEHGLFEDVNISYKISEPGKVQLLIFLKERPRLSRFVIEGVSKSDRDDIKEKLDLRPGSQITENVLNDAVTVIKKFYIEKGFFDAKIDIKQEADSASANRVSLKFTIAKNKRIKIKDIVFVGNSSIPDKKLHKAMKKTKKRDWKFWNSSKFIDAQYKEDKGLLIAYYNEKGYRDAKIVADSFKIISPKRMIIYISLFEGKKYYFRDVKWIGNTKYPSDYLSHILGIKRGDVFDQNVLDKRLQSDEDAVSSLYLDNGYLFFNVSPTEVLIDNDSIDFEMRMYEGKQATINAVTISGNTKTNDHVIRREINTLPGELFSKSDIIRSVRMLAALGHFEPEKIEPVPNPNPANSTVDIEYKLVEKANDQLEVSGGWGGYYGFIGTVGVKFSNFSYRNFFKWSEWRPVPSGDGQTLSLRLQTNGKFYQMYSLSFSDPWFGGKKPNSLSMSAYYSHYNMSSVNSGYFNSGVISSSSTDRILNTLGINAGLGKRLRWPDQDFSLQNEIGLEQYTFRNYPLLPKLSTGTSNNFSYAITLSRYSLDQPIYPRTGSSFSIRCQLTPPYSLFNGKDYSNISPANKYKWVEYHKWTFKSETYTSLVGNLVLMTRANFGILGMYNSKVGYPPVEKYDMGGSGLGSYNMTTNVEVIALRGYGEGSLTPRVDDKGNLSASGNYDAGNLYDKFTLELRHPITLKEQATIFVLGFAEAGNCWHDAKYFNPFDMKRSAGVGVRVFLPMFGLLGFDMGYGFDLLPNGTGRGWEPHFTMGQQF